MLLKLNDLTRSLDYALATTHSNIRVFLITAEYCTKAVWMGEKQEIQRLRRVRSVFSLPVLTRYIWGWLKFENAYFQLKIFETALDLAGWWQGGRSLVL